MSLNHVLVIKHKANVVYLPGVAFEKPKISNIRPRARHTSAILEV